MCVAHDHPDFVIEWITTEQNVEQDITLTVCMSLLCTFSLPLVDLDLSSAVRLVFQHRMPVCDTENVVTVCWPLLTLVIWSI